MRRALCFFLLAVSLWLPRVAAGYGMTPADLYPQEISSAALEQVAVDHMEAVLREGQESRRHTVTAAFVPRPLRVPEGEVTFDVIMPNGLRYWGNTSVHIHVLVDGAPFRRIIAQMRLHIFDSVVVAARAIRARQTLTLEDLRVEEQEIGASGDNYYTDPAEVVGLVSHRRLAPGQPLLRTMVKKPHLVKSGDIVTIVASVNGVEVKMEGVVLDSGREDEIVRVRNTTSRRVIKGRVVAAGTVEVVN